MSKTEETEERDFTSYADKEPTGTMTAFADWLIDEVGVTFPNKVAEAQFRNGVRLGGTLRMEFQASDYWKEHELNPRSDSAKASKAAAKPAKPAATAKPAAAKPAAAKPAAPASRRGAAKPAAATTAKPRTGRRGAAAAASNAAEAPY